MLLLSWIADFEQSSVKRNFGRASMKEMHDLHDISLFGYFACKIIDAMEREYSRITENSSHFDNKLHLRSTNACRINKIKCQRHRTLSESTRYCPLPINFLSFDVLDVFQSSSFIFLQSWMHLWFKGVKIILSEIKSTQRVAGRLTYWPFDSKINIWLPFSFYLLNMQ